MKKVLTLAAALMCIFALAQNAWSLTYNVTVPAGTNACYIAGGMNSWSPSASQMAKVDATHYTITFPNAKTTDEYKYLSGPDWKYVEKDINGNELAANRTWTESDVVVRWASVFQLDERDVTIEVLVNDSVKVLYLVGSFNSWASPSEDYKMTFVSANQDGKVYSKTVHSLDAKNMEFKFCAGPAWSYEQKDPSANFVYGTTAASTAVVVNSFKAYFDPDRTGTINITATVPTGTDSVWIQGDFLGWNMDKAVLGTKNIDGTFSFSIPMVMSIEYRLYNKPDWDYPEVDALGAERANRSAVYPADANINITVINWRHPLSITDIIDGKSSIFSSDNTISVEGVKSLVEVFDIGGRCIQSKKISGSFQSRTLSNGLYLVRVGGASTKVSVQ